MPHDPRNVGRPTDRCFTIVVCSSHPDARELIVDASTQLACNIDWGDDQFASIEVVEHIAGDPAPDFIAGWEMEPGEGHGYPVEADRLVTEEEASLIEMGLTDEEVTAALMTDPLGRLLLETPAAPAPWSAADLELAEEDDTRYNIVRFCFDESSPDHRRVIEVDLTLAEAKAHCNADGSHGDGWFDGFEES